MIKLEPIITEIKTRLTDARNKAASEVNYAMLQAYWDIGKIIVENEQSGEIKAQYGTNLLPELSKRLTTEMGRGFSRTNLQNMRKFYLEYPICQTVSGKLTWSHYCELLGISDKNERDFYQNECTNSLWSVRELNRQIETGLFERVLLSDGKANKEKVLELAKKGITINNPVDILKSPYVFEFIGVPEPKPMLERELEAKLIRHLEDFLLELGRGFMFVGSQQRITLGNIHYYIDMVFYNKILKAYILIDLKTGELKPEHIGQMNTYLNYYKTEVNDEGDNAPVGIILCKTQKDFVAEYALGGLSNQLFAANYVYYIPEKEQLIAEVKALLEREGDTDVQ
ncbi:MAG: PDDEXK nuclease domain-containing protein [Treponema sp.]|jgi:predicted nuclease of restriction endonuclease-like (RecB) superfamily|nr:PDDEXK nuclease domain-containing protein [Treponema sp.]